MQSRAVVKPLDVIRNASRRFLVRLVVPSIRLIWLDLSSDVLFALLGFTFW